jgi:hypothetical protein
MADITICTNDECPLADSCYRHNAPRDSHHQSYQKFEPHWSDDELDEVECHHYYTKEFKDLTHIDILNKLKQ